MPEHLPKFHIDRSVSLNNHPLVNEKDFTRCKENLLVHAIDDENDSWIATLQRHSENKWIALLDWTTWKENDFEPILIDASPLERLQHFNRTREEAIYSLNRMYKRLNGEGELEYSPNSLINLQRWMIRIHENNKTIYGADYINPILIDKKNTHILNSTYWGYLLLGEQSDILNMNSGMINLLRLAATFLGETLVNIYSKTEWSIL